MSNRYIDPNSGAAQQPGGVGVPETVRTTPKDEMAGESVPDEGGDEGGDAGSVESETTSYTVEGLKEAVEAGELTTEEALELEQEREGGPRSTAIAWLEARLEDEAAAGSEDEDEDPSDDGDGESEGEGSEDDEDA